MGFVAAGSVIIIYIILITKAIYVAKTAKDQIGSYIAIGIVAVFTFHMLENIGMTMGLLPVTRCTTSIHQLWRNITSHKFRMYWLAPKH